MNRKRNIYKLIILAVIVLLAMAAYMTIGVKFHNERLMRFAFKIRYPKLIAMVITAFTIGGASIVFQSVINNTIVTPCLLGMFLLYTLQVPVTVSREQILLRYLQTQLHR